MQAHLIRHSLDTMHIEKNVSDNIIRTIMGDKDTPKVRHDMQEHGIRDNLWMVQDIKRGKVIWRQPPAPYALLQNERKTCMKVIGEMKVPTGYGSAFRKHVEGGKWGSLKSHDHHILLQGILPVSVRGLLHPSVRAGIIRLSTVFQKLTAKVVDPAEIPWLREFTAETLCLLEAWMPPSFWDLMSHLVIHLVDELEILGPVACRWMYPMERYLGVLKSYVGNRARPEGSMATGYSLDEALGFVTSHIRDFPHSSRRIWDNDEEPGISGEVPEGAATRKILTDMELRQIHNFVISNSEDTAKYQRSEMLNQLARSTCELKYEHV